MKYTRDIYLVLSLFKVNAVINKGKDFTLHSIEINAIADPGSYVAFAAMPNDLYSRGMNDGLTENDVSICQFLHTIYCHLIQTGGLFYYSRECLQGKICAGHKSCVLY